MNEQSQPWEYDAEKDKNDVPMIAVEVQAFPPRTKEPLWSKKIAVPWYEHSTVVFQINWLPVQGSLANLGQIEVVPTWLEFSCEGTDEPSFLVSDNEQRQLSVLAPDLAFRHMVLVEERPYVYTCKMISPAPSSRPSVMFQVHLQVYQIQISLPERNLWWLTNDQEHLRWQGNTLIATNPSSFLTDLAGAIERFIAEAGVIGYQERRWKRAAICLDLGNVAQAVGAYLQATQFYGTSIQVFRRLGDLSGAEQALLQLRNLFLRQGNKERAKRLDLTLLNLRSEKGHSSH